MTKPMFGFVRSTERVCSPETSPPEEPETPPGESGTPDRCGTGMNLGAQRVGDRTPIAVPFVSPPAEICWVCSEAPSPTEQQWTPGCPGCLEKFDQAAAQLRREFLDDLEHFAKHARPWWKEGFTPSAWWARERARVEKPGRYERRAGELVAGYSADPLDLDEFLRSFDVPTQGGTASR